METSFTDEHKISAVENPAVEATEENSRDQWYDDLDNLSEPPDAGEIDDNSSSSDFEDTYIKKKKKKKKVCYQSKIYRISVNLLTVAQNVLFLICQLYAVYYVI